MGASGAAEVLYAKEAKDAKTAAKAAKEAGDDAKAAQIMDDYKKYIKEKEDECNKLFCNPYNAARYGYIDDVIEPRNTRFRIIRALQQLQTKKVVNPAKKHGNIPL
jgi:acetyl-CoA carboxylase carboxyltransferase component